MSIEAPAVQTQGKEYGKGRETQQIAALLEESGSIPKDDEQIAAKAEPVAKPDSDESPITQAGDGNTLESGDAENEQQAIEAEDAAKPVTLKELAENLEIDAKDLYDVEIALGHDESATLGTLKDAYKEFKTLKAGAEEFEAAKMTHENEKLVATRQIDSIISAVVDTGAMTPQLMEQIQAHHAAKVDRARRETLIAMPQWADEIQRNADFADMAEELAEYGWSETQIRGTIDSSQLKAMMDLTRMKKAARKFHKEARIPTSIKSGAALDAMLIAPGGAPYTESDTSARSSRLSRTSANPRADPHQLRRLKSRMRLRLRLRTSLFSLFKCLTSINCGYRIRIKCEKLTRLTADLDPKKRSAEALHISQ